MDANTMTILENVIKVLDHPFIKEKRFQSPESIAQAGDRIIQLAEELMLAKAARIVQLETEGPEAYYNYGELTVVLLRDGKEKFINFGEFHEQVVRTNDPEEIAKFKLEGPPNHDGYTYFIHATPGDYGQRPWGLYLSKEEALILKRKITKAQMAEFGDE